MNLNNYKVFKETYMKKDTQLDDYTIIIGECYVNVF